MSASKQSMELRLLKVVVQPIMVLDDGNSLREVPVDPITVPANEWPNYPTGRFVQQMKELQGQLAQTIEAQQQKQPQPKKK